MNKYCNMFISSVHFLSITFFIFSYALQLYVETSEVTWYIDHVILVDHVMLVYEQ